MAVVTSDLLAGVLTNFQTLFGNSFDAADQQQPWKDISMTVNSNNQIESYNWLGTVPVMEDVTHQDLRVEGLFAFNFNITNLLYKAGIEVERQVLEDDRLSQITPRVNQLGREAARHPGQLIFNLFLDNGNAYDGVAFFADTRVIGRSANIDNSIAGTGTTIAQIQTDLATARETMRLFQDDQGRPMNLTPTVIVCHPNLEQTFYQALNINQGAGLRDIVIPAGNDTFKNSGYMVITNPYLTDINDWYVLHIAGEVKPFIYQTRVAPALEGITSPNSESGVIRDRFVYSVRARYAVGYGEPRHAIRIINA